MSGGARPVPRLIVGISRSRASWWALAWAIGEARRRQARLLLVHVFRLPLIAPAWDYEREYPGTSRDSYADRVADGNALIQAAIGHAAGQMPGDVTWEEQIIPGRPAAQLVGLACGDDQIVLGSRHRGWLRRLAPGSVARGCARRAGCPVISVPEPSPDALLASLPTGSAHGRWFRRVPHRRVRTAP